MDTDNYINLQVDKIELELLLQLLKGQTLTPAENRELAVLLQHCKQLLDSVK